MNSVKKILKIGSIGVVVLFGAILFMLSRQIAGYRAFVVLSGSMEPAISTGSLIVTTRTNPHTLKEQDIVTFVRPDNTSEFITHRIIGVSKPDRIPLFETKGDNNDSPDTWTLVGGGVVGKVLFAIPHLGYLLSLARTKIGIALLILIPSFFIIFGEIKTIMKLISQRKRPSASEITAASLVLIITGIASFSLSETDALLADSVTLTNNTLAIIQPSPTQEPTATPTLTLTPTPTTTPSPTVTTSPTVTPTSHPDPCGNDIEAIIEGNAAGSVNEIIIDRKCKTIIKQSNNSSTSTTIIVNTTTGGQ